MQTLRSPFPPHPKTHMLIMRLSRGQDPSMCVFTNLHSSYFSPSIENHFSKFRDWANQLTFLGFTVDNWGMKAKRRKTTGTGRMRTMKEIPRKFKNGFQTGTPKGSKGPSTNA
ncbi:MAG: hypothetical protein Q9223_001474 [Gallowayella weberi]